MTAFSSRHAPVCQRRSLLAASLGALTASALPACGGSDNRSGAAESAPQAARPAPARLALVLSGGGLRGFAHLGVLRALHRLGIEPDLVVGCSVGAVIGALYASGAALDTAHTLAAGADMDPWSGLLVSPKSRSATLAGFLRRALAEHRIEAFPRRFVAVATARDSGELRAFGSGDAVSAVLASAALPGALAPVVIGDSEYVDGGIVQPLPVRAARALGAERVVAVDVSFHPEVPAPSGRIDSMFHAGSLMSRNLAAPDRAAADVLIAPVLPPVPEISWQRRAELVGRGELAALECSTQLHALAAPSLRLHASSAATTS